MLRPATLAIAVSTWLAVAGAYAAPARVTDGTSNTILFAEVFGRGPGAGLQDITDGTSNTILLPEVEAPAPEPAGAQAALAGVGKVRVGGVTQRGPLSGTLTFDVESDTFSLVVGENTLLTGHLVARGTDGDRFGLFFDPASRDLFTDQLANVDLGTTGELPGAVLGESIQLELTLDEAGARLTVKAVVLTASLGEIVLKANLRGAVAR
jgi:hypothetical protein